MTPLKLELVTTDAPANSSNPQDVTELIHVPGEKSTGDVSALTETASRIDALDAATDDILERYRGRYDEIAKIAGCEKHTVERWGPRGLSRPRSWHVAGMSAGDAKFRAMVAPIFGFDASPISPEELDAFLKFKATMRAASVAADVTNLLDSGGK